MTDDAVNEGLLAIADDIEKSDGLVYFVDEKPVQLGIRKTAMVIAALRAVPSPNTAISEEERHAIAHARHQVKRANESLVNSECCFDYMLVQDLLRVIDRKLPSPDTVGVREALEPFLAVIRVMDFYTAEAMPEMIFPKPEFQTRFPDEPRCVTLTQSDFRRLAALSPSHCTAGRREEWQKIETAPKSIRKFAEHCNSEPSRCGFVEFGGSMEDGRLFVLMLKDSAEKIYDRWCVLPEYRADRLALSEQSGPTAGRAKGGSVSMGASSMLEADMSTKHRCHGPNCPAMVPYEVFMCARHWRMIPKPLQGALRETWASGSTEAHQRNSREAIRVVGAAEAGRSMPGVIPGMKALTLWQPWASLIMIGAKPYEFRKWNFSDKPHLAKLIGQRIVIHAGARKPRPAELQDILDRIDAGESALDAKLAEKLVCAALLTPVGIPALPLAAALGTAILGEPNRSFDLFKHIVADSDRLDQQMYAWPLTDIQPFPAPVPAAGAQGFWNWS